MKRLIVLIIFYNILGKTVNELKDLWELFSILRIVYGNVIDYICYILVVKDFEKQNNKKF